MNKIDVVFEDRHYDINDYEEFIHRFPCGFHGKTILLMKRNQELLFAILHLLNKEITYIPIDPTYPMGRIQYIVNDSDANFLFNNTDININLLNTKDCHTGNGFYGNDIVYILYTSGSTGNPKGVKITREALFNFMDGISEVIDFSPEKRIACLTSVSFDIFFLESIMALYKGLTVVLANEDEQRNAKFMAKLIHDKAVDMIQMTPSRMQLLLNHDKKLSCLKNVKEIMIGGEPFPLSLLRTIQEKTTAKIYNMYGPTETTIWSTVSDLTHKNRVDIGRPIKDTKIFIVDENLYILSNGQAGEICISGKGLAQGYVGRDDLTAEKFICLPQKPDFRIYRTGDMGRYLTGGDLEYLGRTDNQVKIRGHRIELEEIEMQLNQFDGIKQSVVIVLEIGETDKILEAFYTSDSALEQKDISDYLSLKLPEYMIPTIFKHVESFIQTANGKIDRKRVLECVEIKINDPTVKDSNTNELGNVQQKAFEVIVSNLNSRIDNVTLETSFGGAGVDSITFITIVVALEGEFNFEFDDEMLLITAFPTIKSMTEYVESKTK